MSLADVAGSASSIALLRTSVFGDLLRADRRDAKGDLNALDDCRFAVDPVGFGNGQLVHAGWIHTHPAGSGDRCGPDSCDPGPQPSCVAVLARVEQGSHDRDSLFNFVAC